MFFMNANVKQGLLHWSSMQSRKGGKKVSIHSINANNISNKDLCIGILLLLLSHFSRVWLCETPQTAAHQAPPSLEFSRQEHWSGLPFPSPMQESESEVSQSRLTLSDPMDCSLPESSIHGVFQARVLESGVIAFSAFYWRTIQKALMEEVFILFLNCKIPDALLWRFEPRYHT